MAGQYTNIGTVIATANGATIGASDPDHYFGVVSNLAGFAWLDKNANGQQAAAAIGIAGVAATLLNAAGTATVATTNTDTTGHYRFNAPAGTYIVQFASTAAGYNKLTAANVGSDATDSDANVSTGRTGTFAVVPGAGLSLAAAAATCCRWSWFARWGRRFTRSRPNAASSG